MGELGDGGVEEIDEFSAGPGATGAYGRDRGLEMLKRGGAIDRSVLDDTDRFELLHIERFSVGIELLEVLFASGVAREEVNRPAMACFKFGHAGAGFVLGGALDGLVAARLKIAHRYLGEGDEVCARVQLGKEEIAVFPEEGGHEAELAGFLGRDEIAPDIVGRCERLLLLHTPVEAVEETTVRKRHVREARRGHR